MSVTMPPNQIAFNLPSVAKYRPMIIASVIRSDAGRAILNDMEE